MTSDEKPILVANKEGVRTLTLNRPAVLNAVDLDLIDALNRAIAAAGADKNIRCLVITGAGRAFCAGQDLGVLAEGHRAKNPVDLGALIRDHYNPAITKLRALEKPVIAAVNGAAAGAGCSLALACDFRIVAESASFIQAFVKVGLLPDVGSTWMLPRLVGEAKALEMALTGRKVGAKEALEIGLATQVVTDAQLSSTVEDLARRLADLPTKAIGLAKRAIHKAWTSEFGDQLALEAALQTEAGRSQDHREGVAAFVEKRKPVFKGR